MRFHKEELCSAAGSALQVSFCKSLIFVFLASHNSTWALKPNLQAKLYIVKTVLLTDVTAKRLVVFFSELQCERPKLNSCVKLNKVSLSFRALKCLMKCPTFQTFWRPK